jgi:TRAP-type C4-dicarboxylate transport system substrate-binding protein
MAGVNCRILDSVKLRGRKLSRKRLRTEDVNSEKRRTKMKSIRKGMIFVTFLLMVSMIFLSGTSWAVTVGKDGVITMKLAHVCPLGSPSDLTAIRLKDLLKERTNGKIVIEIFPNEQLGIEKAAFQGVVVGTIDMSMNDAAYVADLFSPIGVLDFPYMYKNWEHYEAMLTSKPKQDLAEAAYKKLGARFPAAFLFGRRILCSNKPVRTLADTKEMNWPWKMRGPSGEFPRPSRTQRLTWG